MTVGDHRQRQKAGTLSYSANNANYMNMLPTVHDPSQAYASIIRGETEDYMKDYDEFERALASSISDTSLIDAVPEQVETQTRISKEIAEFAYEYFLNKRKSRAKPF